MPYQPILATLGYLFSADRTEVLLVNRVAKGPADPHYGKYNGLGGKVEADEDIWTGMCREIQEEAGVQCEQMEMAGTISWPGFGKNGEDWFGFVFRIFSWKGDLFSVNEDGQLHWIPITEVLNLPLWEGDRHFLPLVFDRTRPIFHGVMPYQDGSPLKWNFRQIDREIQLHTP